jgi:hypothetical protein
MDILNSNGETIASTVSNENTYKLGAPRKIKKAVGRYYLLMTNAQEQREFNGLPGSDSPIILLDENVRKNAESQVDGYEMVYEVISIGEDCDIIANEVGGAVKVAPIVGIGDVVLAKGHVFKVHCEPVVYAAVRENIVAVIKTATERKNYVPVL